MKVIGFEEHFGLPFIHDAALKADDLALWWLLTHRERDIRFRSVFAGEVTAKATQFRPNRINSRQAIERDRQLEGNDGAVVCQ